MDFETRYNAMEHAKIIMLQRLLMEVADMKGDRAIDFIDAFRNACASELGDTQQRTGDQRPAAVTTVARSIVEGVCSMAKDRLQQRRAEGDP